MDWFIQYMNTPTTPIDAIVLFALGWLCGMGINRLVKYLRNRN